MTTHWKWWIFPVRYVNVCQRVSETECDLSKEDRLISVIRPCQDYREDWDLTGQKSWREPNLGLKWILEAEMEVLSLKNVLDICMIPCSGKRKSWLFQTTNQCGLLGITRCSTNPKLQRQTTCSNLCFVHEPTLWTNTAKWHLQSRC